MRPTRDRLSGGAQRRMATWEGLSRRTQRAVLISSVAAVAAGGVVLGRATSGDTEVRIVRGEVDWVALDGVAVALADREDSDALFVVGTGQGWTDVEGSTHSPGQPECLPPDSRGAVVELSVLPEVEGTYPNEVVWVRCITLPAGSRLGEDVAPLPLDDAYQKALEREP
jgi:hypothetical protein